MMEVCEVKYYASYSQTEYQRNLLYMLDNEVRLQTFQQSVKSM